MNRKATPIRDVAHQHSPPAAEKTLAYCPTVVSAHTFQNLAETVPDKLLMRVPDKNGRPLEADEVYKLLSNELCAKGFIPFVFTIETDRCPGCHRQHMDVSLNVLFGDSDRVPTSFVTPLCSECVDRIEQADVRPYRTALGHATKRIPDLRLRGPSC